MHTTIVESRSLARARARVRALSVYRSISIPRRALVRIDPALARIADKRSKRRAVCATEAASASTTSRKDNWNSSGVLSTTINLTPSLPSTQRCRRRTTLLPPPSPYLLTPPSPPTRRQCSSLLAYHDAIPTRMHATVARNFRTRREHGQTQKWSKEGKKGGTAS